MDILNKINLLLGEDTSLPEIINLINRDCSKFLKEAGRFEFYRGTRDHGEFFFKGTVRKDRRPKDIPVDITEKFNKKFEEAHGVKNIRNVSLFVYGSSSLTTEYGKPYRIFPIGDYTYWWNPNIQDLYNTYEELDAKEKIYDEAWDYININLTKTITGDNEIMFVCDEYYAIAADFSKSYNYVTDRLNYGEPK